MIWQTSITTAQMPTEVEVEDQMRWMPGKIFLFLGRSSSYQHGVVRDCNVNTDISHNGIFSYIYEYESLFVLLVQQHKYSAVEYNVM